MYKPRAQARTGQRVRPLADLLRLLSEAPGPSGHEQPAALIVMKELARVADQVAVDALGSVVALKRATVSRPAGKKVLVAAHLDEVGLLVTRIEPGGFLRFTQLGTFDVRVLLGQEVLVHPGPRQGRGPGRALPGVIGAKPPHFQTPEERAAVVPMSDLYIDIGMEESAVQRLVSVGDVATLRAPLVRLLGDRASGKAMDDRASVAVMVRALDLLRGRPHGWDVYAVATVQEEAGRGYLGAVTSAFRIRPDLAVVLDVTHADMPQAPEHKTFALARGPAVTVGPNVHPAVAARFLETAKRLEIPCQLEPIPGATGTDAVDIQVSGPGIPTGLVSLPTRYMHTPVETVSLLDMERLARLLCQFLAELDTLDLAWRDGHDA